MIYYKKNKIFLTHFQNELVPLKSRIWLVKMSLPKRNNNKNITNMLFRKSQDMTKENTLRHATPSTETM